MINQMAKRLKYKQNLYVLLLTFNIIVSLYFQNVSCKNSNKSFRSIRSNDEKIEKLYLNQDYINLIPYSGNFKIVLI